MGVNQPTIDTRCGLSSFGYSGTIAHALMRQDPVCTPHCVAFLILHRRAFSWELQCTYSVSTLEPDAPINVSPESILKAARTLVSSGELSVDTKLADAGLDS